MLIPSKHEDLNYNVLVIGSDILRVLKKENRDIESLFAEIRTIKEIGIELFYNALLFLWLAELIAIDDMAYIKRNKK